MCAVILYENLIFFSKSEKHVEIIFKFHFKLVILKEFVANESGVVFFIQFLSTLGLGVFQIIIIIILF